MALIIPSVATLGILGVPSAKYALSSENSLFSMTCPQIEAWLLLVIRHSKVTLSLFLHIVCVRVEWVFFSKFVRPPYLYKELFSLNILKDREVCVLQSVESQIVGHDLGLNNNNSKYSIVPL